MKYSKKFRSDWLFGQKNKGLIKYYSREQLWGYYLKSNHFKSFEEFCKYYHDNIVTK